MGKPLWGWIWGTNQIPPYFEIWGRVRQLQEWFVKTKKKKKKKREREKKRGGKGGRDEVRYSMSHTGFEYYCFLSCTKTRNQKAKVGYG